VTSVIYALFATSAEVEPVMRKQLAGALCFVFPILPATFAANKDDAYARHEDLLRAADLASYFARRCSDLAVNVPLLTPASAELPTSIISTGDESGKSVIVNVRPDPYRKALTDLTCEEGWTLFGSAGTDFPYLLVIIPGVPRKFEEIERDNLILDKRRGQVRKKAGIGRGALQKTPGGKSRLRDLHD
jgi:hypothetical protein